MSLSKLGFVVVTLCLSFFPPFFPRVSSAADLDKIFDLLTKPPKESGKSGGGEPKQQGLPQLFQMFDKKASSPSGSGKPKGFLSEAMKDVDVGKQIEEKTVALEKQLQMVFVKIRTYQAMNGAIWLNLGKNYNSLVKDLKSFEQKGASGAKEFITHTKVKQNQQMELIGQVTLDASAGLSDSSETIQLNHKKNQKLREGVKHMIGSNPIIGCAFEDAINQQNVALDKLLNAYMQRLSQITQFQMTSAEIFTNMSKEFKDAEKEMRKAIATFNEEGALVSLKAAEHLDVLYAQARELRSISKASSGDLVAALTVLPKIPSLLDEIQRLTTVFNNFKKVKDKLASESVKIGSVCVASGAEIEQSSRDLAAIGAEFQRMWADQVKEIRKIADKRKVQVKDLSKTLKEEAKKNKMLASKRSRDQEQKLKEMANKTFGEPIFD